MLTAKLLLLVAALGQYPNCPNGQCAFPPTPQYATAPTPAPTYSEPIPATRHWYETTVGWVRGWKDSQGMVRYFQAENSEPAATRSTLAAEAIRAFLAPARTTPPLSDPPPIHTPKKAQKPVTPLPNRLADDDDESPLFPLDRPLFTPIGFKIESPGPGKPIVDYGMDASKTFAGPIEERIEAVGPKAEAFASKLKKVQQENQPGAAASLQDDSLKPYVIILGSDAEQKAVLERLKDLKGLAHLCPRSKENWDVRDVGFVRHDKTTGEALSEIVVEQADGGVVDRLPIDSPAEPVIEAVRKANKDYNPDKDVKVSGLKIAKSPEMVACAVLVAVVLACLLGGLLLKLSTQPTLTISPTPPRP
jgi:hypothetical protein